jgi:hypothetical protein
VSGDRSAPDDMTTAGATRDESARFIYPSEDRELSGRMTRMQKGQAGIACLMRWNPV